MLKGLHVLNKLTDVEIISAVSGGSYTATWLYDQYAQQVSLGASGLNRLDRALSRESIKAMAEKIKFFNLFQGLQATGNLAGGSDVRGVVEVGTGDWITGVVVYGAGLIKSIIPPWKDSHETQSGSDYEENIGRTFQNSPNSGNRLSIQTASPDLPYLIVNATIQGVSKLDLPLSIDNPNPGRLANDIFEFTSYGMGYKSWAELRPKDRAETYSFSRVASISGAAVHKGTLKLAKIKLMQLFGRDLGLGYAVLTPTYNDDDMIKRFLLLTDGGESENLGVYGLIKRNCKEILMVDAEYDGGIDGINKVFYGEPIKGYLDGYQFKSYQCLKQKLGKEGRQLMIDTLDQATNRWDCEGKNPETNPEIETPLEKLNCWTKPVNTKRTWFDCSEPISTGYVRPCQDKECKPTGQEDMRVTYVKLSANRKLLDARTPEKESTNEALTVYGPGITEFYNSSPDDFPHYSTFQFNWNPKQFLAIAELGCRAVVRYYAPRLLSPSGDGCALIDRVTTTGTGDKK